MHKHGITCYNCHDPHKLNSSTTTPVGDALCMKCHGFGSPIGPHQKDALAHAHCTGASYIDCHMPKTGQHLKSSPVTVRSHAFGFITPDDTRRYGVPNACTSCHDDQSLEWAEGKLREWGMTP